MREAWKDEDREQVPDCGSGKMRLRGPNLFFNLFLSATKVEIVRILTFLV